MSRVLGFIHTLEWSSPYVEAPGGKRVMMEVFIPSSDEGCRVWPKEMEERYWELRKVYQGPIYCHVIKAVSKFPKELDKGKLASLRRKRLQRRMEEKYPLFAEMFVEEEMKRKANYYNGITDPHLRAAREEVRMEHEAMVERLVGIAHLHCTERSAAQVSQQPLAMTKAEDDR